MNFEDLSEEMKGVVRFVAENLDLADAGVDLNEALYQQCRLANINPWLAFRIVELAEEYLNVDELPTDFWEESFLDEEELLGMAIDWDALYGYNRYRLTTWDVDGNEHSVTSNDGDYIITLIAEAERDPSILSYMLERGKIEIINTSNRVKHD